MAVDLGTADVGGFGELQGGGVAAFCQFDIDKGGFGVEAELLEVGLDFCYLIHDLQYSIVVRFLGQLFYFSSCAWYDGGVLEGVMYDYW